MKNSAIKFSAMNPVSMKNAGKTRRMPYKGG